MSLHRRVIDDSKGDVIAVEKPEPPRLLVIVEGFTTELCALKIFESVQRQLIDADRE